ncbi:glycoside hydrolase family 10 protein [Thermothelomyces thermophilus ATCC 42464]|uniref:Glycoside hydrolase family 10 protein n=1 Tax=Thermothelomyces thermophilus (strain ATCC 42464 / BCRC 31852 / DSM 1799) TaxID=573729 RepID=G2Q7T8_THET4|nr:glycoside hydrolase family 10 protein [Thermothelomyces thermophilus ATCC 42464]AEO56947.1 glycoside hydrolase family 10 protein [Thermothelomyces thermophilus ATCC 42464]
MLNLSHTEHTLFRPLPLSLPHHHHHHHFIVGRRPPEALRGAITRHIRAVAGYYRGRCYAWDVVNEALDEDGTYRKSLFYNVLGDEYIRIVKTFEKLIREKPKPGFKRKRKTVAAN